MRSIIHHLIMETPSLPIGSRRIPLGRRTAPVFLTPNVPGRTSPESLKVLAFDQTTGRAKEPALDIYVAKNDAGGAWAVNTAACRPTAEHWRSFCRNSWDKVFLVPVIGGRARQLTKDEGEDETPTYSPDGKSIAIVSNREFTREHHNLDCS